MTEEKAPRPAAYAPTDEAETLSVDTFKALVDHKWAKLVDIRDRDKIPNIDGYIELVDDKRTPIGKLEVQIKKLSDNSLKFQCPTSLFAYSKVTPLPVLLVGVDTSKKRAYWIQISEDMLEVPLAQLSQETVVVHFPENNVIDTKNTEYIIEWQRIAEFNLKVLRQYKKYLPLIESSNPIIGSARKDFVDIQVFLDHLNSLLDGKFNIVKKTFYPTSWKVGLAYFSYMEKEVHYTLYPIHFGKNDVMIKEVDSKLRDQLDREGFGWRGYSIENPIRTNPKKHAIEIIGEKVATLLERHRLNHKGSTFLAQEYVFAFVDKFIEQLGLEDKDEYSITEIEKAFFRYLPLWTDEAIKFMLRVHRNNVKSLEALLYRKSYFDPEMLICQISEQERKQISVKVNERIEKNENIPVIPIGNNNIYLGIFYEFFSFLKNNYIEKISRLYSKKDFFRLSEKGNLMYYLFSSEALVKNLSVFFRNLPFVYELVVRANFPEILPELPLFNGGSRIVVIFDIKDEIKSVKDFPSYELYALKSSRTGNPKVEVLARDAAQQFSSLSFANSKKTIKIEGKSYELVFAQSGVLDFIYEDTPMFNLIYELLKRNLRRYFEKVAKTL